MRSLTFSSFVARFCAGILFCAALLDQGQAADLSQLLGDGHVPGMAYAVIRDGKIADLGAIGMRDISTRTPVDENTVFEAASLGKPVFVYAVLQLVDAGTLSLDTPLSKYAPDFVKDDPRAAEITVADVLSQTSGLPNWASKTKALKTYFQPGSRFSYSAEGFIWLQRVVVKVTGESLEDVMARLVFEPLKMNHSSYAWRVDFEPDYATPYDTQLGALKKRRPEKPLVASTLHTTAADYARFLQAVLSGERLKPATAKQWLAPHIVLRKHCIECIASDGAEDDQHIAWGLGWGLEPDQGSFFHWGDNKGFKSFATGWLAGKAAIVVLTNSDNGMAIMPDILARLMPGEHPSFAWLGYERNIGGWLGWLRSL